MQEAIREYITQESEKKVSLDDIGIEIDKVAEAEIQRARRKQRIEWRKLNR